MPEVTDFQVGSPNSTNDAYYACDGCCSGFIGPQNDAKAEDIKQVVCPRCSTNGSGGGIRRVDPLWIERRFEESAAVVLAEHDYRNVKPEVMSAKIHEARKPFLEQGSGEEVKFMATDTATKSKRVKKEKTVNKCACGCDGDTFSTWCPGHDARFYSAARKVAKGDMKVGEFQKLFPTETIKKFGGNIH